MSKKENFYYVIARLAWAARDLISNHYPPHGDEEGWKLQEKAARAVSDYASYMYAQGQKK